MLLYAMQLLVDLAIERDAEIPALVYEARPTVSLQLPPSISPALKTSLLSKIPRQNLESQDSSLVQVRRLKAEQIMYHRPCWKAIIAIFSGSCLYRAGAILSGIGDWVRLPTDLLQREAPLGTPGTARSWSSLTSPPEVPIARQLAALQ